MIFVFETEQYTVYEGPLVGKVLKIFVFNKAITPICQANPEKHQALNTELSRIAQQLEQKEVSGYVLVEAVDNIHVVPLEELPQIVRDKFSETKSQAA